MLRSHRLLTIIILILVLLSAWMPRATGLDELVTIDETRWLAGSANFLDAISQGEYANTYQKEHPGVTVLWMGALGIWSAFPSYAQEAPKQFSTDWEDLEPWLAENSTHTPLELLAVARWWIALAAALFITVGFFPLRKLFGTPLAALISLYVAWMPFLVGLSRLVFPGALLTPAIYLALISFLAWIYGGRAWRYALFSGFVTGLALFSKTPAIWLAPTALLLVGIELLRVRRTTGQGAAKSLLTGVVLWGLMALATFVLLWPSMWVAPVDTIRRMVEALLLYGQGHDNPLYFFGSTTARPGFLFYPVAFLLRASPATTIGLILAPFLFWRRAWPFDQSASRRTTGALLLFAVIFIAGMSLSSKQLDRYMLPAMPPLAVIAILAWSGAAQKLLDRFGRATWVQSKNHLYAIGLATVITLLLHGLPMLRHAPYYLTYYNPLTGGNRAAQQIMVLGWGEGLEHAAQWLSDQPDSENASVVAWYRTGPISYYYQSQKPFLDFDNPSFWTDADYAVTYINQWQRQLPEPQITDRLATLTPLHTVQLHGIDYVRIYDAADLFAEVGEQGVWPTVQLTRVRHAPVAKAGNTLPIRVHAQGQIDGSRHLSMRLVDEQGTVLSQADNHLLTDTHLAIDIPAEAAAGSYTLVAIVYDPDTLASIPNTLDQHLAPISTLEVR